MTNPMRGRKRDWSWSDSSGNWAKSYSPAGSQRPGRTLPRTRYCKAQRAFASPLLVNLSRPARESRRRAGKTGLATAGDESPPPEGIGKDAAMPDPRLLTAREAARRIAEGRLTAEAMVTSCLERIEAREGVVGAWQYLDRDQALAEARRRDSEAPRGPLHGIPIAVKDLIDTCDMPTAYGSPIYRGHRPAADASCVALARAAGAVVLGKTVTTEFATFTPGKTVNPRNPAHTPGGSSSGSAAAVADGMVPLAFGTQTAGSVIRPG